MPRQLVRARMAALTVLAVLVSTFTLASPAQAAESVPTLKWSPAPVVSAEAYDLYTSPTGSATINCTTSNGGTNLVTYSGTGVKTQDIPRAVTIDGVTNCIISPTVDKNGSVYGVPLNTTTGSYGPNLLAYNGNTLKWKYPAACGSNGPQVAAGANGNIYFTHRTSGGDVRLIGLTPNVATGQTQPTKVLDIDVDNDCTTMVQSYKDGLVLHGQSSGNARYYSYAGKFLGQATIGDVWYEKINADGKLFVASYVGGSYTSGKVTMYDPLAGQVEWAIIASTSGANVNEIQVYPVSGGGVVAKIIEQKMISGIPASPTEYITTLKVLNSSGIITKSMELPSSYSQSGITGTYGASSTYPIAVGQGKLAVVRDMYLNSGVSNPPTVQAIYIGVYDIASDSWTYQQVMRGDLTKTGGPSGYRRVSNRYGVTNNILYLSARCTNNCTTSDTKLYALNIAGLSLDYPRGDVLAANTPAQPAPVSYVALGDSFASGEGVAPFDDDTDTQYNKCHRSKLAHATFVSRNPSASQTLVTGVFRACSGATTTEIGNSNPNNSNEPAQQSYISSSTQTISITIGGNDIGFPAFGTACFWDATTCRAGSTEYTNAINKINNVLPPKLRTTYANLLSQSGNNAKIYVMGYPHVAPVKTGSDPYDARCPYLWHSGALQSTWADAQAARDVVNQLNAAILAAVTAVKTGNLNNANARLQFVDVNGSSSPFVGHEICSSQDSYFLNVDQAAIDQNYIFHPNAKGQKAYADILAAYIASH